MKNKENALRHFAFAFLIAVGAYVLLYWGIERLRPRKGPWVVTFAQTNGHPPAIYINQHRLGITNVHLSFPEAEPPVTNFVVSRAFDRPGSVPFEVPFGQCIFLDTTFLPGTVTLKLFGHEIELLPRTLVVDHREHAWTAETIDVFSTAGPAVSPAPE